MTPPSLTRFQHDAERRISQVLAEIGRKIDLREVRTGVLPFYSPDEQIALKLRLEDLEIWLFDNEASFATPNDGRRFEHEDYDTDGELLQALLRQIREAIS